MNELIIVGIMLVCFIIGLFFVEPPEKSLRQKEFENLLDIMDRYDADKKDAELLSKKDEKID